MSALLWMVGSARDNGRTSHYCSHYRDSSRPFVISEARRHRAVWRVMYRWRNTRTHAHTHWKGQMFPEQEREALPPDGEMWNCSQGLLAHISLIRHFSVQFRVIRVFIKKSHDTEITTRTPLTRSPTCVLNPGGRQRAGHWRVIDHLVEHC